MQGVPIVQVVSPRASLVNPAGLTCATVYYLSILLYSLYQTMRWKGGNVEEHISIIRARKELLVAGICGLLIGTEPERPNV